jgi:hypothetical protein
LPLEPPEDDEDDDEDEEDDDEDEYDAPPLLEGEESSADALESTGPGFGFETNPPSGTSPLTTEPWAHPTSARATKMGRGAKRMRSTSVGALSSRTGL